MANGRKTKKIKKSDSKTKSDNKNKETDVEVKREQYATIVHFVTQVAPPMIAESNNEDNNFNSESNNEDNGDKF